jgi:co-chaperonin GroES (HSP10)
MEVSVGDTVLFEKWGGEEIEIDGVDHKIISADKIVAIIS